MYTRPRIHAYPHAFPWGAPSVSVHIKQGFPRLSESPSLIHHNVSDFRLLLWLGCELSLPALTIFIPSCLHGFV